MITTLERRLIGARKKTYKPRDGYEDLLGSSKIIITGIETPTLENNLRIKNLQVLHLEDRDNLARKIALVEDIEGNRAAVYFYQDIHNPKREEHKDSLSYNLFGSASTVGQIRVLSPKFGKNKNADLMFEADQLVTQLSLDSRNSGLKFDRDIGLSGSGVVVVTDLNLTEFIGKTELHYAIGELFNKKGVFKNNIIIPSVNNVSFVANMEKSGAKVLFGTKNFPNILELFSMIISENGLQHYKDDYFDKLLPLMVYVPFFERLFSDKEVQIKFSDIKDYMKKQLLPKIKQILG